MATIYDVAKLAGVSVATVSYVINGSRRVAPETAERVRRAMEELDYHPNAVARSLRTRRTLVVGAVVSDIANPFFATLVRGAEDFLRREGYTLLICNTSESAENERLYLRLLLQKRVDGLLIAPTGKEDEILRRTVARGLPLVFIDRKLEGIEAPAVLSRNEEGALEAMEYLIGKGHRRIGVILGLPDVSTTKERFQGYLRALQDHGIVFDERLVAYGFSRVAESMEACRSLLSREGRPTAIFATNNLMAIGTMKALRWLGLSCPKDVSVIGFDDFEWAEAFDPPLTTVAQDPYRIGYEAARALLELIGGKRPEEIGEIRIDVELRVRESVAPLDP